MLDRIETRTVAVSRVVALLGFGGLLTLALMTTLDVLLRWLFQAPLHGVNDVSSVVIAVVIASCIPANLAARQNIAVEVVGPLMGARTNRLCRFFASAVTLGFIVVMAWKFIPYTEGLYNSQRRTWVLAWVIWPWWAVATVFLWCAVIVQAVITFVDLCRLWGGNIASPTDPEVHL